MTVSWHLDAGALEVDIESVAAALVGIAFFFLLAAVLLTQLTGPPAFLTGWRMALFFLLFAFIAMTRGYVVSGDADTFPRYVLVVIVSFVLIEVIFRSAGGTVGLGLNHGIELAALFALFLVLFLAYPDPRSYAPHQWAFVGCFVIVLLIVFYHLVTQPPQVPVRWPVWAALVAGINLLVIPRFVPERVFLWSLAALSTLAAIAALPAVVVGEYTFLLFEVQTSVQTIPLLGSHRPGPPAIASVFNNVNVFGLVSFAGAAASAFLLHRSITQQRRQWAALAGTMFVVTAIGLVLSNSGVAWLAAATCFSIYLSYLVWGRDELPVVIGTGGILVLVVISVGYVGLVPVDDSQRFVRWRSGIDAFRAVGSLLGAGHVSTIELTQPFIDGSPATPHNAYLEAFLRFGLLGGAAYTLFVLGAIAYGAITASRVNVAMLALAAGWAVHHLFESYTFFHWTAAAVLSTLAFGYLLFGDGVIAEPSAG